MSTVARSVLERSQELQRLNKLLVVGEGLEVEREMENLVSLTILDCDSVEVRT